MKKKILALMLGALMMTSLVGCGNSKSNESAMKIGMATDSGTIDDRSFNQGTWEGIQEANKDFNTTSTYMKPAGETDSDYLTEIQNLYDSNHKFIILPGFKFERASVTAQEKYPDAKFVLIDSSPIDKEGNLKVADNTVSIFFAEQQAGFAAGIAAAVELKEGDLGFIGGMKVSSVQKFDYGFQQGVEYANANYGTNVSLDKENIVYAGSFVDTALGQQLAATMYDKGVKAIFSAAGGTGSGVISEAKTRAVNGEKVWVIGVDSDQYEDGIYDTKTNASVILTSAIKKIDQAAYQMIEKELEGKFPGGEILTFDASNDGVGIPEENPNLSDEAVSKVKEVLELMKSGTIEVKAEL